MASTGFLRTVNFGGFDKKDVLSYVDELNSKIYNLESELTEKKALLEGQENVSEFDGAEKYEAIIAENKTKISEYLGNIDTMKLEISNLENELTDKNSEIDKLKDEKSSLEEKLESANSGSNSMTDASFDIGSVFIEAKQSADKIIAEAKKAAKKIEEDSNTLSQQIIDDANTRAESIVNEAQTTYNKAVADANQKVSTILEGTNKTKQIIVSDYETVAADIEKLAVCLNDIVSTGVLKMTNAKQLIEDRKNLVNSALAASRGESVDFDEDISSTQESPAKNIVYKSTDNSFDSNKSGSPVAKEDTRTASNGSFNTYPNNTSASYSNLNMDFDMLNNLTAEIETGYAQHNDSNNNTLSNASGMYGQGRSSSHFDDFNNNRG